MNEDQVRALVQSILQSGQYSVSKVPYHIHNGVDSPLLPSSGSSSSINGLATGNGSGTLSANTPLLVEPTQVFANGITFNATGSDYGWTVITAGQYIITSMITFDSPVATYLYRNAIVWTPSGGATWIAEYDLYVASSSGSVGMPNSIIYNLGVGDLIQLYAETQYTSGTVENTARRTYFAIAKV